MASKQGTTTPTKVASPPTDVSVVAVPASTIAGVGTGSVVRPPIGDVLRQIAAKRTHLDNLDDNISVLIKKIETVLRKHLSVRIEHVMSEAQNGEQELLVFGKENGKWMLMVCVGRLLRSFPFDEDEAAPAWSEESSMPLLSCSREKRTLVFADGHVEALVRSAHKQFETQIALREKALKVAESIAAALEEVEIEEEPQPEPANHEDDLPF